MAIDYLDGQRFRRVVIGGAEWVRHNRDELNRINVFPVADGDTGTNMALSLSATAAGLRDNGAQHLNEAARSAAEASIIGAKGNSGLIMAHWFLGLSQAIGERERIGPGAFADCIGVAGEAAHAALENPVEGTIITVMRAVGDAAAEISRSCRDLVELADALLAAGNTALARTPDQLAVLREAQVVDAGAQGYVNFLDGACRVVRGEPLPEGVTGGRLSVPPHPPVSEAELDARYCTELIVRGCRLDATELRRRFHDHGTSLLVASTGELFKLHIHTDHPDEVIRVAARLGTVDERKVDDMLRQRDERDSVLEPLVPLAEQPATIAVVCDSTADLPPDERQALAIEMVPLQVLFGDAVYRDQVDLDSPAFYEELEHNANHPTTSQPPPRAFVEAFDRIRDDREVLVVTLSETLSGTGKSARTAVRLVDHPRLEVFDSRTASLGLGMLARNAARLAARGADMETLVTWLERWRDASGLVVSLATLEYLRRGGRIGAARSLIGRLLKVRPLLTLEDGAIVPLGKARGAEDARRLAEQSLATALPEGTRVRLGLIEIGSGTPVEAVGAWLAQRCDVVECVHGLPTGVIGAHVGPGAWGVFYQKVDDDDPLLD